MSKSFTRSGHLGEVGRLNQPLKIVPTIHHGLQGDNRRVNAMGASSSRSVLFGKKKKKHKPAVSRALSVLRGALRIKTPKKKKKNKSLLTLHGWGPKKQKKQKREGPFKSWLSLDGEGKKKRNKLFGNSSPKKDSVFKPLPTTRQRQKGGNDEGSGKEEKDTNGGFLSNKGPPQPFIL